MSIKNPSRTGGERTDKGFSACWCALIVAACCYVAAASVATACCSVAAACCYVAAASVLCSCSCLSGSSCGCCICLLHSLLLTVALCQWLLHHFVAAASSLVASALIAAVCAFFLAICLFLIPLLLSTLLQAHLTDYRSSPTPLRCSCSPVDCCCPPATPIKCCCPPAAPDEVWGAESAGHEHMMLAERILFRGVDSLGILAFSFASNKMYLPDMMLAGVQGWCRWCRGGAGEVQEVQGWCRLPAPSAPQQA